MHSSPSKRTGDARNSNPRFVVVSCALFLATVTLAGAFHHAASSTRIGRAGRRALTAASHERVDRGRRAPYARSFARLGPFEAAPSPSRLRLSAQPDVEQVPADAAALEGGDEDAWRTVLAALRMYKAAYGDLKVPSRFVVPGMAPWPGETREGG
jgi:hypothetical protein